MSVGGVGGGAADMSGLMQVLQQGMQKQTDLSKNMISVGVENSIIGEKMALAQEIIDVYA